jgi:hypothetical protein
VREDDEGEQPLRGRADAPYLRVGAAVAAVWTGALLLVLATRTDGVARALSFVGAGAAAFGGIFQQVPFPSIKRHLTARIVVAVLSMDLLWSAGWTAWRWYEANRAIDVTAHLALGNNTDVKPHGQAALDIDVRASRKAIAIVFEVADHNGGIGSCVPNTTLSVTPLTAGNRGRTVPAAPGVPVTFGLSPGTRHLHLDIAVHNVRDDINCGVNVYVSSAKLTNG